MALPKPQEALRDRNMRIHPRLRPEIPRKSRSRTLGFAFRGKIRVARRWIDQPEGLVGRLGRPNQGALAHDVFHAQEQQHIACNRDSQEHNGTPGEENDLAANAFQVLH